MMVAGTRGAGLNVRNVAGSAPQTYRARRVCANVLQNIRIRNIKKIQL